VERQVGALFGSNTLHISLTNIPVKLLTLLDNLLALLALSLMAFGRAAMSGAVERLLADVLAADGQPAAAHLARLATRTRPEEQYT
jgi:hypothetical protein